MYQVSSLYIATVLMVSMLLALELGYILGKKLKKTVPSAQKEHIHAIQASILGILALLLGFTFSLSLERYDSRSEAVVDEANAIGTAYLRAQMLPAAVQSDTIKALQTYTHLRVQEGNIPLDEAAKRNTLLNETALLQNKLWSLAKQAVSVDAQPVKTGLYIQALNDLIDQFGKKNATLDRHVPEVVLYLLYITFLMAGAIVGYSSGVSMHRPSLVSYIMVLLIVVLVYIILDLDHPRRGLIAVSQQPLVGLAQSMRSTL